MKPVERFVSGQWIVLWAMIGIVLLSVIPLGSNRPVSWIILALAITLVFVGQIVIDSLQPLPHQARGLWFPSLLFLGAVTWGWIQTMPFAPVELTHPVWQNVDGATPLISADPGQGRQVLMRYLCYAMIFWIAFRASVSSVRAGMILKTFAVFSTVLAVFGLYALATGVNPVLGEDAQSTVLTATFVNRNSYATYAAFGLLANLAAYLHIISGTRINDDRWESLVRDILERFFDGAWIYALGFLICLGALSLTQSRAGGISTLVGLLVFAAAWRGHNRKFNPFLLIVLILVVGFIAMTSATGLTNRFLASSTENARFLIYPEVITAIMDRPILGHGLGAFHDVFRQYVPAEAAIGEWVRAHNSYLENAFELGLPAAAAFYLALVVITMRIASGTVRRKQNRAFSCFALSCIAAAGVHSMFDFSLQMPAIAAIFAVILAMGWAQSCSRTANADD